MDLLNRGSGITRLTSDSRLPEYSTEAFNDLPAHVWPRNARREADGSVSIAGVNLRDIAAQFGTPVYVVDEDDFRSRCRDMAEAFGGPEHVHYASKAFLNVAIAHWVNDEGLNLDVASDGELAVALRSGFPAHRITLHGNNKTNVTLRTAVENRVGHIVVDSMSEVRRLAAIAQELGIHQEVLVRVTPGVHADTHEFIATSHEDQKFGLSLASGSARRAALEVAHAEYLVLAGLHCHVGSQVFDADGFSLAAERVLGLMADLVHTLEAEGNTTDNLGILDLGGGYGIAYTPDQSPLDVKAVAEDLLQRVRTSAERLNFPCPEILVEPGRAIAGPSTVTVYEIGTVKTVHTDENSTRRYLATDGGMSDNIRPALYGAVYDGRLVNRFAEGTPVPSRVVGSHCESGDILIENAVYPDDIREGDLLAIAGTGAYCYSMSSRYNMFRRPAVVAVKDGAARLIVRRETLDDLLALDVGV